jgi:hypothetical protein
MLKSIEIILMLRLFLDSSFQFSKKKAKEEFIRFFTLGGANNNDYSKLVSLRNLLRTDERVVPDGEVQTANDVITVSQMLMNLIWILDC